MAGVFLGHEIGFDHDADVGGVELLVDDGAIAYKMVGPVTPENFQSVLRKEIDKALKAGS